MMRANKERKRPVEFNVSITTKNTKRNAGSLREENFIMARSLFQNCSRICEELLFNNIRVIEGRYISIDEARHTDIHQ